MMFGLFKKKKDKDAMELDEPPLPPAGNDDFGFRTLSDEFPERAEGNGPYQQGQQTEKPLPVMDAGPEGIDDSPPSFDTDLDVPAVEPERPQVQQRLFTPNRILKARQKSQAMAGNAYRQPPSAPQMGQQAGQDPQKMGGYGYPARKEAQDAEQPEKRKATLRHGFVGTEEFKDILDDIGEIRSTVQTLNSFLVELIDVESKHEAAFKALKTNLTDIEKKYLDMDKTLFEQGDLYG